MLILFEKKKETYEFDFLETNNYALGLFERDHQEVAQVHLADLV
jgi:hypothetical protein